VGDCQEVVEGGRAWKVLQRVLQHQEAVGQAGSPSLAAVAATLEGGGRRVLAAAAAGVEY
jgi:hypothetical protein